MKRDGKLGNVAAWFLLALVGVTLLVAPAPARAAEDVLVALTVSLTTDWAIYGKNALASVQMAADKVNAEGGINGRKIRLVAEDAGNSNTVAVNALNKALGQNPAVVIGPPMATMIMAMLPVLKDNGVPFLAHPGTRRVTQQGYPAMFRFVAHDGVSKVAWTRFAVEKLQKKKLGLLIVANEWGYSARDVTSTVLKSRYNMEPAAIETYQATDKDMSAQLVRLKNAGVDLIVQQGHVPDTALILKQARQLNIGVPIRASSTAQTAALLDITEGADVTGLYVEGSPVPGLSDDPVINQWGAEREKRAKSKPDQYAVVNYDIAMCLFEVMKKYGIDRPNIVRGLPEIRYQGLIGVYQSDKEGNMLHEVRIYQYDETSGTPASTCRSGSASPASSGAAATARSRAGRPTSRSTRPRRSRCWPRRRTWSGSTTRRRGHGGRWRGSPT
jgi:branched-chain amino acid transport system substrate-binding protein